MIFKLSRNIETKVDVLVTLACQTFQDVSFAFFSATSVAEFVANVILKISQ